MKPILISEIFGPTIQGEGALVGRPTVFVRTGGCDFRCHWCDTIYAVLPEYKSEWTPMSAAEIVDKVLLLSGGQPILVTLSGGNPALHDLEPLLDLGRERGLTVALETQGTKAKSWFAKLDFLVLSPKGPSSQMTTDWDDVARCIESAGAAQTSLKFVVFDEDDYNFAALGKKRFPHLPIYFQVGTQAPANAENIRVKTEWMLQLLKRDGWFDATLLPQLHVLLWGDKRGV